MDRSKSRTHEDRLPQQGLKGLSVGSVLLIVGLLLGQVCTPKLHAQGRATRALEWTRIYAEAIGLRERAGTLDEYLKHLEAVEDDRFADRLRNLRQRMRKEGFDDFSDSPVYAEAGFLMIACQRRGDQFNAKAVFFRDQNVAHSTSGPTLIAMARAAEELAVKEGRENALRLLFPKDSVAPGNGTFHKPYKQTERFRTDKGWVTVKYRPTAYNRGSESGTGMITIVVQQELPQSETLIHKEYDIDFRVKHKSYRSTRNTLGHPFAGKRCLKLRVDKQTGWHVT